MKKKSVLQKKKSLTGFVSFLILSLILASCKNQPFAPEKEPASTTPPLTSGVQSFLKTNKGAYKLNSQGELDILFQETSPHITIKGTFDAQGQPSSTPSTLEFRNSSEITEKNGQLTLTKGNLTFTAEKSGNNELLLDGKIGTKAIGFDNSTDGNSNRPLDYVLLKP